MRGSHSQPPEQGAVAGNTFDGPAAAQTGHGGTQVNHFHASRPTKRRRTVVVLSIVGAVAVLVGAVLAVRLAGTGSAAPAASPNGLSLPSDLNLPSSSLPGSPGTAAVTPSGEVASPLSASGPAAPVPTSGRTAPSSPAGGVPPAAAAVPDGPTVAATGAHLYRITPGHTAVEEYTGKDGAWAKVRGAASGIFTSATTLYATDPASGDIEQYDRGRGTWTRIGTHLHQRDDAVRDGPGLR